MHRLPGDLSVDVPVGISLPDGFRPSTVKGYWIERTLPDGQLAGVGPQLFGAAHIVRAPAKDWNDEGAWAEQWMYSSVPGALTAFAEWEGTGEPEHWIRHKPSNRRRIDGDPEKEFIRS